MSVEAAVDTILYIHRNISAGCKNTILYNIEFITATGVMVYIIIATPQPDLPRTKPIYFYEKNLVPGSYVMQDDCDDDDD